MAPPGVRAPPPDFDAIAMSIEAETVKMFSAPQLGMKSMFSTLLGLMEDQQRAFAALQKAHDDLKGEVEQHSTKIDEFDNQARRARVRHPSRARDILSLTAARARARLCLCRAGGQNRRASQNARVQPRRRRRRRGRGADCTRKNADARARASGGAIASARARAHA